MSIKFFAPLAGILFAASAANASIVDLNDPELEDGEILFDQIDGLTVTATGGAGEAVIIDTEDATDDPDLQDPFDDPDTVGDENFNPGNVLAVAESGCGMGFCNPDDNAGGGTIFFDFDRDVVFNSLDVFDLAAEQLRIILTLDGMVVFDMMVPSFNTDTGNNPNNNLFTTVNFGGIRFDAAEFIFSGSGAIGNFDISEVPLPAGFILMMTGVAGFSFARRRKAA